MRPWSWSRRPLPRRARRPSCLLLLALALAACGGSGGASGDNAPDSGAAAGEERSSAADTGSSAPAAAIPQDVTFSRDVAPVLFDNCVVCHRPDGVGPFSLLTYDDARRRAQEIGEVTGSGFMPPWQPEPGWGRFSGERRLSRREVELLAAWVAAGAPEGDPVDLPEAPAFTGEWDLGAPDLVVEMSRAYTLPTGDAEVFRDFVIPLPLDARRYVRAIDLRPGNSRIVHHAVMAIDKTRSSRALDDADPEPGYVGNMILSRARGPDGHFLGWTPGKVPHAGTDAMSWRLDRGTDLVLQLHMLTTGKEERIQPRVGFYFSDRPPELPPFLLRLGSQTIDIPAGEPAYAIEDEYELPVAVELVSIYPHAHYLGKEMKAWAELPGGDTRELLWIRDWDFNWQDAYRYETPVALPARSRLKMRYVYDNSAGNVRNPSQQPRHVTYGPRSSDEMGDLWLQVFARNAGDRDRLGADFQTKSLDDAITGYEKRLEADPEDPDLLYDLGVALGKKGDINGAISRYRRALEIDPGHAYSHYNLGLALAARGEAVEALSRFRTAIDLRPDYVGAYVNLGVVLAQRGDLESAVTAWTRALELDPANADAHNNLGVTFLSAGNLQPAADHFREALITDPDNAQAHNNLGVALEEWGDIEGAIREYREALRLQPRYEQARRNLDIALRKR